jgi:carbonic anhydrase
MQHNHKDRSGRVPSIPLLLFALCFLCPAVSRHAEADGKKSTVTPEQIIARLKQGNARFQSGKGRHPHTDVARLHATARQGQHPEAIVLSCADSRVCPELLFDQGIGDLFTIRVAGNVCNEDEIGSIDYAAEHLHVSVCIVMGHSECGAVSAVVAGTKLHGGLEHLVVHIRQAVRTAHTQHPTLTGKALVAEAVHANVWEAIADMLQGSETVRERVRSGKLKVVGAVYDLDTGRVRWLGVHPRQKELLQQGQK